MYVCMYVGGEALLQRRLRAAGDSRTASGHCIPTSLRLGQEEVRRSGGDRYVCMYVCMYVKYVLIWTRMIAKIYCVCMYMCTRVGSLEDMETNNKLQVAIRFLSKLPIYFSQCQDLLVNSRRSQLVPHTYSTYIQCIHLCISNSC